MRTGAASFARDLRGRAVSRPWAWAVPAAALAAAKLVAASSLSRPSSTLASRAVSILAAALFAELWTGDGRRVDGDRLFEAVVLFFLPYPFLVVLNWIAARVFVSVLAGMDAAPAERLLTALAIAGILMTMLASVLSAVAFERGKDGADAWTALGRGARILAANAPFVVAALAATWLAQDALAFLAGGLDVWAVDARPEMLAIDLLWTYLHGAVRLAGCVAVPMLAASTGRLRNG